MKWGVVGGPRATITPVISRGGGERACYVLVNLGGIGKKTGVRIFQKAGRKGSDQG